MEKTSFAYPALTKNSNDGLWFGMVNKIAEPDGMGAMILVADALHTCSRELPASDDLEKREVRQLCSTRHNGELKHPVRYP